MLSHAVLQQYESALQILVAQGSQLLFSLLPCEQMGCAQVPPPQDLPQIEATSPTQIESHAVLQQYESAAQILPAQGSQLEVRGLPCEQIGCEQPPPPWQVPPELQVWPDGQEPQVPPQPSGPQVLPVQFGVQVEPQVPFEPQVEPCGQVPQVPPQPSGPQFLPVHCGVQPPLQVPFAPHDWPDGQVPQEPPQPSLPQVRPVQFGVQVVPL